VAIVVEGDTESAAFIASIVQEKDPLATQVTLVPSRGKALISPLIRLLTHFGIPFGVLHDMDAPLRGDGKKNGAWTENHTIIKTLTEARAAGIEVRHRVSVPNFERRLGASEESKDKPMRAYRLILGDQKLKAEVKQLFIDLYSSVQLQPLEYLEKNSATDEVANALKTVVREWAAKEAPEDPRFKFTD
jgi:putative ATP-dependent endonuclease of the OLD family